MAMKDPIGVRLYNGPERRRSIESPPQKWRLIRDVSAAELIRWVAGILVGLAGGFVYVAHWADMQMQRSDMFEHQLVEQDTRYTRMLTEMGGRIEEIRLDVKAIGRRR